MADQRLSGNGRPVAAVVLALGLVAASCGDTSPAETTSPTTVPPATTTTSRVIVTTSSTTTTTTIPVGPPIAVEGDRNATVEAIQSVLNCLGFGPLTVDGSFGPGTRGAVEAAQGSIGRPVTGAPDDDTFAEWSRACLDARSIPGEGDTVVGNAAVGDPEMLSIPLALGATLTVTVLSGSGVVVGVLGPDEAPLLTADGVTWEAAATGDHVIEVSATGDPVTFVIEVAVTEPAGAGDWVIFTKGITYRGTTLTLGDPAEETIDQIYEFLGHGTRSGYGEFDTGWDDPGQPGFRGIFIEGIAFLFYGPNASNPTRPMTFGRVRYVGPSRDADGNLRPRGFVATGEGITVGDTLAQLKSAYGTAVVAGNNAEEHYYRYNSGGGLLCFYFGADPPTDASTILEISTECRS